MGNFISACWWGGNLLILLALLHKIPPAAGWAGFVVALSSFFLPGLARRYGRSGRETSRKDADK
ncbi:MAG TPA: hypothetical protein VJL29_14950 [Thermoguttaceae bacterium]|nr:hypothetical protein [Thermoguttaceae bacterium]